VARTIDELESTVSGDGTLLCEWPKTLTYTYSGARLGGTLVSTAVGDRPIYDTEKSALAALMARSAAHTGSDRLLRRAKELTALGLSDAGGSTAPLGKIQGQYLARLHAAVAQLAALEGGSGAPPPPPPPPAAPAAPTDLVAIATSPTDLQLSWTDNAHDELLYAVQDGDKGYADLKTVPANTVVTAVGALTPGASYSIRVEARNDAGSAASAAVVVTMPSLPTPPAAPSGLAAVALSATEARLTWVDNASDETSLAVQRWNGVGWLDVQLLGANLTSTTVAGLAAGTTQQFRVEARNAAGAAASAAASVTLPGLAPAAPTGLVATALSPTQVRLVWNDVATNETSYVPQRWGAGEWVDVQTLAADTTATTLVGLSPGVTFQLRVEARNAAGAAASATVTITTPESTPSGLLAPTNVAISPANRGAANVSWVDNATGETGYSVQQRQGTSAWAPVKTAAADATKVKVTGLTVGATYGFRVCAEAAGASACSGEVLFTATR
jgi:titin